MKQSPASQTQEIRLETSVEMGTLCAFYGGLLTEKQLQALELHYDEDLSLGEIARQMNVSRQSVHDLVIRSGEKLRAYEEALGLAERTQRMLELLRRAQEALQTLQEEELSPGARARAQEAAAYLARIQQEEEDAHGV